MKPARKRRLMIIGFILLGMAGAAGLLFAALGNNMNHYYELKAIKSGEAPIGKVIRIGGLVEKGSIKRQTGTLKVDFVVTDMTNKINVKYDGILPDLFREGQGVLAKGTLTDKSNFVAEEILAKHDENYMPKEVKEELEKSGYYKHAENTASDTATDKATDTQKVGQ
ncbi:MAG: cytochrome c maturation protein CcmE [Gammaproteobacteria bacterium]|nr:cytochrome c maturation protein CcmE [Gammaproteobacteria bacterium]